MLKMLKNYFNPPSTESPKITTQFKTTLLSEVQSFKPFHFDNLPENYLPYRMPVANRLLLEANMAKGIDIPRVVTNPVLSFNINGYTAIPQNSNVFYNKRIELRDLEVFYLQDLQDLHNWEHIAMRIDNTHTAFIRIILVSNTNIFLSNIEFFENVFDPRETWNNIDEDWNVPWLNPPVLPDPPDPIEELPRKSKSDYYKKRKRG